MRISLLDRSRVRTGESDADAVQATVSRAKKADALGFHRFWTAEHHAVPGIASASPSVLLSAIGAHTRCIRLGTGGIMVPNHSPMVIAEQALLLEALYPGRVDLGLGGSLGFTPAIRRALGRTVLQDDEYAAEVEKVGSFLGSSAELTIRPHVSPPPMFLLAIKGGLSLAAQLGLPVVVGGPLLQDPTAIRSYFTNFQCNATGTDPYLIVSVDIAIAQTADRARELLLPEAWAFADSRDIGEFRALRPVEDVQRMLHDESSAKKHAAVHGWADAAISGDPGDVRRSLDDLVARTGAAEVMASVSTYDRGEVDRIDEALAAFHS